MMHSFLKSLSYTFAALLSGFSGPEKGDAAVLMYHAVDTSGWRLSVTPREFERQLAWLKKHRTVVPLTDVVALAKNGTSLPQGAVALTFDDGYADLVPTVLPLLEKYQMHMTLFLNTDVEAQTTSQKISRVDWDDVRRLQGSGLVSIQSHCRTHPHLPRLTDEEVQVELEGAARDIKEKLGTLSPYFAYPYGDRSQAVEAAVTAVGHEAAFAIGEGFVRKGSNLLRLPRIQVDATMTPYIFALRLTPALTLNRRIVDALRRVLRGHSK